MKGYLYIEGKLSESPNLQKQLVDPTFTGVADGAEILREGFHKLFEKEIPDLKVSIVVEMGGPWTLTLKKLAIDIRNDKNSSLALVDYQDLPGDSRKEKIENAIIHLSEKGIILTKVQEDTFRTNVFFMIQQVEGWFLSQPETIEECLKTYKIGIDLLKDDPKIAGIPVDTIKDPANVLNVLLGRFFERAKKKKLKYHKVWHAALFLENLNTSKLKKDFPEFDNLINAILKNHQEKT